MKPFNPDNIDINRMRLHAYRAGSCSTRFAHGDDQIDELGQIITMTPIELIDFIANYDENIATLDEDNDGENYVLQLRLVAKMHNYPITDDEIAQLYDATMH